MVIDPKNLSTTATLSFGDDFNSLSLRSGSSGTWSTGWNYSPVSGQAGYNNELEWYVNPAYAPTASANPFSTSNGVLNITAKPATSRVQPYIGGQTYTSGMINTYHSFAQTYGYFEMSAKLPAGQGLWPAFWLMPTDGSWPPELDVMEVLGNRSTQLYTTVHSQVSGASGWIDPTGGVNHYTTGAGTTVTDTSAGFHTYGVDWEPDKITWYFDGQKIFQAATPADMNKPMYLIANLAVGGDWPGSPISSTKFPATMQIDYIRAYNALTASSSGPSVVNSFPDSSTTQTSGSTNSGPSVTISSPESSATQTSGSTNSGPSVTISSPESSATQTSANHLHFGAVEHSTTSSTAGVYALYEALLGRAPDALGLEVFTDSVQNGATLADVANALLASSERAGMANATTDPTGLVQGLYQNLLGRVADASGLLNFTSELAHGMSPATVAVQLATSAEAQAHLAPTFQSGVYVPDASEAGVARLYYGLLARAPDADGLQALSSSVENGGGGAAGEAARLGQTAAAIIGSPEYQKAHAGQTDTAFVASLYAGALGRAPDAGGQAAYLDQLAHGVSRATVALEIAESPEAQVHLVGVIEQGFHLVW